MFDGCVNSAYVVDSDESQAVYDGFVFLEGAVALFFSSGAGLEEVSFWDHSNVLASWNIANVLRVKHFVEDAFDGLCILSICFEVYHLIGCHSPVTESVVVKFDFVVPANSAAEFEVWPFVYFCEDFADDLFKSVVIIECSCIGKVTDGDGVG